MFLTGYTSVDSEGDVRVTDTPDTIHLTHRHRNCDTCRGCEMFTPRDNARVIPVMVGVELSYLHQRTGECQQQIKKLPIPTSLNPSPATK